MDRELLTWALVGAAAVSYIAYTRTQAKLKPHELGPSRSAQNEIDPTRWKHNGTQTMDSYNGNRFIGKEFYMDDNVKDALGY